MTVEQTSPTFVLGVGAQKAGTTWLHRYLSSFTQANMGCMKEYHIWDAKLQPQKFPGWITKKRPNPDTNANAFRRILQEVEGAYAHYFSTLIEGDVSFTGDITPSYAGLEAEDFSHIKALLEQAGFKIRVVFILRDPVERCWSGTRMHFRTLTERGQNHSNEQIIKAFVRGFGDPSVAVRTRYQDTIQALEQVFEPRELHIALFEDLFSENSVKALSDFLGLEAKQEFAAKRFNETQGLALPLEAQKACFNQYRETYEFCWQRFPQTKTLWKKF